MPLDFTTATQLFMGTEEELARALGVSLGDVRAMRTNPGSVPRALVGRLCDVLAERGRAMVRVAEMLREDSVG
ncbi:MAG TPA: hypothetical protein VK939_13315 [Longimicrobiales bacterium]|nr:hypothetical protein [Longimicrobiales bacterium]